MTTLGLLLAALVVLLWTDAGLAGSTIAATLLVIALQARRVDRDREARRARLVKRLRR